MNVTPSPLGSTCVVVCKRNMDGTCETNIESPLACVVYELPGEPAVVIDGVPEVPVDNGNVGKLCNLVSDAQKRRNTGFGQWLEGREVRKLFDNRFYLGAVTEFDKDTGWYRVVYEDGDFEDLEWEELQEVLQPLDITMPLKSLALKMMRKTQKSEPGIQTNVVVERKRWGKTRAASGRGRVRNSRARGNSLRN